MTTENDLIFKLIKNYEIDKLIKLAEKTANLKDYKYKGNNCFGILMNSILDTYWPYNPNIEDQTKKFVLIFCLFLMEGVDDNSINEKQQSIADYILWCLKCFDCEPFSLGAIAPPFVDKFLYHCYKKEFKQRNIKLQTKIYCK